MHLMLGTTLPPPNELRGIRWLEVGRWDECRWRWGGGNRSYALRQVHWEQGQLSTAHAELEKIAFPHVDNGKDSTREQKISEVKPISLCICMHRNGSVCCYVNIHVNVRATLRIILEGGKCQKSHGMTMN
jgi:hypothetical protein